MPPLSEHVETITGPCAHEPAAGEIPATWHALSCMGAGVITTDREGRVAAMNAAAERMTGWRSPESAGQPLESVFRVADAHTGATLEVGRALGAGETVLPTGSAALASRDGTQIAVEVSGAPMRDGGGRLCGGVVTFQDVGGRRRAEEALSAAERRKDEFLATLAHELRNPLAPIRQAALILRAPQASEAQRSWSLDVIDRQLRNLSTLLEDLLSLSRVTRGALVLRIQPTGLAALIDAAVETARPLIDARRQRLTVQLPDVPVRFGADPLRMAQVLSNLLTNAAKYTDPEGQIDLSARLVDGGIEIRVADTGIGIAAEALPHMFEMFARGAQRRGAPEEGLGIGLALTKGLVELHGGRIEAASEGLGRGSQFTVRLPNRPAAEPPAPPAPVAAPTARRMLVADDNRDSAQSLATLLRLAGHEVAVAHDGPEALAAFEAFHPEVVLLDIGMPGLDGYEVALRIRQQPAGAGVTLIAITGWGEARDREQAATAGFNHHLTKPVEWSPLAALIGGGADIQSPPPDTGRG